MPFSNHGKTSLKSLREISHKTLDSSSFTWRVEQFEPFEYNSINDSDHVRSIGTDPKFGAEPKLQEITVFESLSLLLLLYLTRVQNWNLSGLSSLFPSLTRAKGTTQYSPPWLAFIFHLDLKSLEPIFKFSLDHLPTHYLKGPWSTVLIDAVKTTS